MAPKKRSFPVNPDEPRVGQYMYGLYDQANPIGGEADVQEYLRHQLRGFGGKRVRLTVRGLRIHTDEGIRKTFVISRTLKLNRYSDIFGRGAAYGEMLHEIREKDSEAQLVTITMELEEI